jgi:DNA invertase Pin-like site-specific DNA recombinase
MLIGYIRALPGLTNLSQRAALSRSDCPKIYEETAQGAHRFSERDRMLDRLWEGDVVTVARLACLADTLHDLLEVGQRLFDREAGLISRAEPWADTTTSAGASLLRICNGLMLLGLAEPPAVSRPIAIPRPPSEDSKVGRPTKITARQWEQYGARILSGELSVPAAAKLIGCGRATLYRHLAAVRTGSS